MRSLALAAAFAIVAGCSGSEDAAGRLWFVDGHVSTLGMRGKLENVVELFVNGEHRCVDDMRQRPIERPLARAVFRGWQGDPLPPPG